MYSKPNSIANFLLECLDNKQAFVFYRKNNSDKVVALIQNDTKLYTTSKYDETGFVMAPFDASNEAILLPCSETEKFFFDFPVAEKETLKKDYNLNKEEKIRYLHLVQKTIEFIQSGKADKVVTSRKIEMEFDRKNTGAMFETLLNVYPDAMVYVWHHPKVGLWIGATPEKMLYVQKDNFSTMSLAGTQLKSDVITWKSKEKKEQQWVTDFIIDQLIPIAHHIEISEPYTKLAGHLAHIRTDIKGYLEDGTSLKDLIFRVHPTPAVCGTPRTTAKEYLLKNEDYNREFYAGFLGELNLHDNTDLFVNLRCMKLNKSQAEIYVGGGITNESLPEQEWEETYQKSLVLAKFLL